MTQGSITLGAVDHLRGSVQPEDFDDLVAFWDFQAPDFQSRCSNHRLRDPVGGVGLVAESGNPWGSRALRLESGQYLCCSRGACPDLDFHGARSAHTVLAWIRRDMSPSGECEFIAGMWNETDELRQYGLFINNRIWDGADRICAHVSATGGRSTGYHCCMEAAVGVSPIAYGTWTCVAMSFDGLNASAWIDGALDYRPGVNPFHLGRSLFDGGSRGSDFTVGSVTHHGAMGNQFVGIIGGLAVYSRSLSPAEHLSLARGGRACDVQPCRRV